MLLRALAVCVPATELVSALSILPGDIIAGKKGLEQHYDNSVKPRAPPLLWPYLGPFNGTEGDSCGDPGPDRIPVGPFSDDCYQADSWPPEIKLSWGRISVVYGTCVVYSHLWRRLQSELKI